METFYLGIHRPHWLRELDVPSFVSRVTLAGYKGPMPVARSRFALDSGAFTELKKHGGWTLDAAAYARFVERVRWEVGEPDFVAPQDWMIEETMLRRTGLSLVEHQARTVANFCELRELLGGLVIPVLQGWTLDDYQRCADAYQAVGVDLGAERLVGLGSVCRRQHEIPAERIVRALAADGIRLHGFGVKATGLARYGDALVSADSMAWSLRARWEARDGAPSCDPARRDDCANCLHYALDWRDALVSRLEVSPCAA